MTKKTKLFFSTLFGTLFSLALVNPAYAQTKRWEEINDQCVQDGVATIQGVACMIANVLSVALTIIGIAGFLMLIVGSMRWLLSGGNTQNVDSAKKTMTFAVIGLVVALSSFMIINLIAQFTGINIITQFFIPGSDHEW